MKENTAIIEMASCAGITIPDHLDPSHATTYGVGSVILDAIKMVLKNYFRAWW